MIIFSALCVLSVLCLLPIVGEYDMIISHVISPEIVYASLIFGAVQTVVMAMTGITAVVCCAKPKRANLCIIFSIISMVVSLVSFIFSTLINGITLSSSATTVISLIAVVALPIFIIYGAYKNKHPEFDPLDPTIKQ